jgi:hypothetical protein
MGRKGTPIIGQTDEMIMRSYRLRDGLLRWELTELGILPGVIRVANDVAYVAGAEPKGTGYQTFLAAYRVADGVRQWKAPGFSGGFTGTFTSLAVTQTAIVAAGFNLIEAHDPLTGSVLWSRVVPFPEEEFGRLLPIGDDVAFIGAKAINPPSLNSEAILRVLESTGHVIAEEIGPGTRYADAAFGNGRLAVVGGISGGALVRVYDMRPFE